MNDKEDEREEKRNQAEGKQNSKKKRQKGGIGFGGGVEQGMGKPNKPQNAFGSRPTYWPD